MNASVVTSRADIRYLLNGVVERLNGGDPILELERQVFDLIDAYVRLNPESRTPWEHYWLDRALERFNILKQAQGQERARALEWCMMALDQALEAVCLTHTHLPATLLPESATCH